MLQLTPRPSSPNCCSLLSSSLSSRADLGTLVGNVFYVECCTCPAELCGNGFVCDHLQQCALPVGLGMNCNNTGDGLYA